MQKLPARSRGISLTGWMFIIAIGLFFGILAMKLMPKYIEFYSIVQVMESLANDPTLKESNPRQLRELFYRRIDINGIYDFPRKALKIKRKGGEGIQMVVDYEIREPVVGNVDVILHFHHEAWVK